MKLTLIGKKADFDILETEADDVPLITSSWEDYIIQHKQKGIKIDNEIYKSKDELMRVEYNFDIELYKNAKIWIISRSNGTLNTESAVIKLSKEDNKVYVSYGVFVRDQTENKIFKQFLHQQLLSLGSSNPHFFKNDYCIIKGSIVDYGEDFILGKFYLNNSVFENVIEGKFFMPVYKKFNLILAGNGENLVKHFYGKHLEYDQLMEFESKLEQTSEKRNCECCLLF